MIYYLVRRFILKEKLYTIPLNDAMNANDECPLCYSYREIEQYFLDLVLGSGSSYMESDMRAKTDKAGFCKIHFKKMFDYGNTLGNAWILKTHYMEMRRQMNEAIKNYKPGKNSKISMFSKGNATYQNSVAQWVNKTEKSCYICTEMEEMFDRYVDTFFYLFKNDPEYVTKFKNSKGFCLSHFGLICERAETALSAKEKAEFFEILFPLMDSNMARLQEDVSWMIEKFDYLNKDADWKNSKDAIQRGMQKLKGGYPSDPPYQQNK